MSQRLHWAVFLGPVSVTVLLALPLVAQVLFLRSLLSLLGQPGLPAFVWLPMLVMVLPGLALFWLTCRAYEDTHYFLTTRRLAFRTGWLFSAKGELPLENVEAVFLVEPMLGSLFGYGTVAVTGMGGTTFCLRFMPEPHRFHQQLQEALEAVRSGRPVKPPAAPRPAQGQPTPVRQTPAPKPPAPAPRDPYADLTPLEKAWAELNQPPPPEPPSDVSRFVPKK